jgi:1-acyl-sn-glycerol-3-phosphate acyltransferase
MSQALEGDPIQSLPWFSRLAFRTVAFCQRPWVVAVLKQWQRFVLEPCIFLFFISRRLKIHGAERLANIPPGAPLLVLANHRSFFDLFIVGWTLLNRCGLRRRISFPVRANFFYENPLGLLINLGLSGGAMFPPFFRSKALHGFNEYALGLIVERLREQGTLVGFHPEGTRNKGADPYTLLPAQVGAGLLALKTRPEAVIIPAFVNGLSNSLGKELWNNLLGREPVLVVFGAPPDLSQWPQETRLTHHKKCSDELLAGIGKLGEEEKALRAAMGK